MSDDLKNETEKSKIEPLASSDNLEQSEGVQTSPEAASSELPNDNPEFDSFVEEQTKTLEQERQERRDDKAALSLKISQEEAQQMAMQGIQMVLGMAGQQTGQQFQLNPIMQHLAATLMTPCIMKHGATLKKLMSGAMDVDENSYMPEIMAVGGAALVGFPVVKQIRQEKRKKQPKPKPDKRADAGGVAVDSEAA